MGKEIQQFRSAELVSLLEPQGIQPICDTRRKDDVNYITRKKDEV